MTKRLLVSLAHPDDESFGSGPLVAKLVAEGAEVTLICGTNGDVGSAEEKYLQGYSSVAEMRLAELDCAAKVLGFKEVVLFGYRDSGMMGSADNNDPKSLWQAPLDEVTDRIVEVMRRVRPQVILTFDPYGGYGHPDHIKINRATLAAFQKVQSDPVHPQKVYYGGFPKRLMWLSLMWMRVRGQNPRKLGLNGDMDFQAVYDNILPTHVQIDVSKYLAIGKQAAECHASQASPIRRGGNPVARAVERMLLNRQRLTRAFPEPKPGEPTERDLFQGVDTNN
jgi:LmbE family N-acetylglucosaminyl deacetylase